MGRLVCILFFLCLVCPARGETLWLDSPVLAVERASVEGKRLFVLFSDPEHCPACQRLEREVLERGAFIAYARERLVLLRIPCELRRGRASDPRHEAIRAALAVDRFPTWWYLDHDLAPLLSGGYRRGGPSAFIGLMENAPRRDQAAELGATLQAIFRDAAVRE